MACWLQAQAKRRHGWLPDAPSLVVSQERWHLAQRRDHPDTASAGAHRALAVCGVSLKPDATKSSLLGCQRVDRDVVTDVEGLRRSRPHEPGGRKKKTRATRQRTP